MSLNLIENTRKTRRLQTWINLWPLAIFLLLLAAGIRVAVHYWPDIVLQSVIWQKVMHQEMSSLLQAVHAQPHQAGLSLLLFSLVYGVLHAVGPGHGKVVITTYLATHPAKLKNSLTLTLASSLLQGLVAIALVTFTLGVLQLSSRAMHASSFWLEKASFVLVAMLGAWLTGRALKQCWNTVQQAQAVNTPKIQRISALTLASRPVPFTPLRGSVSQENACGCGHRHLPSPQELERSDDWRTRLAIVCAMGLRPCSGAILVLLFAKVLGVFAWGVASALAMALGTAITLSLLALLVFYCRRWIERWGATRTPALWQQVAWATLALAGGVVLFGTGLVLYLSAQTAISGGIRPLG